MASRSKVPTSCSRWLLEFLATLARLTSSSRSLASYKASRAECKVMPPMGSRCSRIMHTRSGSIVSQVKKDISASANLALPKQSLRIRANRRLCRPSASSSGVLTLKACSKLS